MTPLTTILIRIVSFFLTLSSQTLAITVFPSNTEPRAYNHAGLSRPAKSAQGLFLNSCPLESQSHSNATVLLSSNFPFGDGEIHPSSDGFIRGTLDAWAQHQHLVIRPDEVWFSILTQLNFYMGKAENAEALRGLFVPHTKQDGKQKIVVGAAALESILAAFGSAIQERVKTDWLLEWITPGFTTSTDDDVITANVLMMGLMKSYFEYGAFLICGLPSVTLLGEKGDWELLLSKLDRLKEFGREPTAYAQQLRPILSRFVTTFDGPDGAETRAFWNSIIHAEASDNEVCGMPPYTISGWILGFLFWNKDGTPFFSGWREPTSLDGIKYSPRSIEDLPIGYTQAPLTLRDYGGMDEFPAYVLAGNVAKKLGKGLPGGYAEALSRFNGSEVDEGMPHGVLEPKSGWLLYGPVTVSVAGHDMRPDGDETGGLCLSLDRSCAGQCAAPKHVQLGVPGPESVAYEAFCEEIRRTLNNWSDDEDD